MLLYDVELGLCCREKEAILKGEYSEEEGQEETISIKSKRRSKSIDSYNMYSNI